MFHLQALPPFAAALRRKRSPHLAMATQFLPTMATTQPPLYSKIDCATHQASQVTQNGTQAPFAGLKASPSWDCLGEDQYDAGEHSKQAYAQRRV